MLTILGRVSTRSWEDFADSLSERTPYGIWWESVQITGCTSPEEAFDLATLAADGYESERRRLAGSIDGLATRSRREEASRGGDSSTRRRQCQRCRLASLESREACPAGVRSEKRSDEVGYVFVDTCTKSMRNPASRMACRGESPRLLRSSSKGDSSRMAHRRWRPVDRARRIGQIQTGARANRQSRR